MNEHLLLPGVTIGNIQLLSEHRKWLQSWLMELEQAIEHEDIASSMCLQGVISELSLYGNVVTDWCGVMDSYLTDEQGIPLAYSEAYGKRLYKFSHWKQSPVHALHTRWWIDQVCLCETDAAHYGAHIERFIQPSGWIYNPDVSPTNHRTRMKSEYMMSLAMGLELLAATGRLAEYSKAFESTVAAEPLSVFLSAEYFRKQALAVLDALEQMPAGVYATLQQCEAGEGYCDFSVASKTDDYMGTLKRTARDRAIHSPLLSLWAASLVSHLDEQPQKAVAHRLELFAAWLRHNPLDIPAFSIRDIEIPFGIDVSPLEVLAASVLVQGTQL